MSNPVQLPLRGIAETAARCGLDVGRWNQEGDAPPQVASHQEVHALIGHLEKQSTAEPLGLIIGRRSPPFDFGLPSRIARHSTTLRKAVERYIHFQTLAAPGCSRLQPHPQQPSLIHLVAPSPPMVPDLEASRLFRSIYPMVFAVANLRRLAEDPSLEVEAVDVMANESPRRRAYEEFFGGPLRLEASHNRLLFEEDDLDTPVEGADPKVVPYLEKLALKEFQQLGHRPGVGKDFRGLVRSTLEEALLEGRHELGDLAEALHMSQRTLQRRLSEEGLSYRTLVDEVREHLALELMRAPEHSLQQIAHRLGYKHLASFSRAFKRWTGRPPGEFRSLFQEGR